MVGWRGHKYRSPDFYFDTGKTFIAASRYDGKEVEIPKVRQPMSHVLWCDIPDPDTDVKGQVGHPFTAKDPERQHFSQTRMVPVVTGNSYGRTTYQEREEITEEMDICGYHWRKQNPFQAHKEALPEGPNGRHEKQKTLQELEEEDEEYRRGYAAAEDKFFAPQ